MQIRIHTLTISEARSRVATIDALDDVAFNDLVNHWSAYDVDELTYDSSYKDFRVALVTCFKAALQESGGKMSYTLDLRMGIKIYELLNPRTGFTNVQDNANM